MMGADDVRDSFLLRVWSDPDVTLTQKLVIITLALADNGALVRELPISQFTLGLLCARSEATVGGVLRGFPLKEPSVARYVTKTAQGSLREERPSWYRLIPVIGAPRDNGVQPSPTVALRRLDLAHEAWWAAPWRPVTGPLMAMSLQNGPWPVADLKGQLGLSKSAWKANREKLERYGLVEMNRGAREVAHVDWSRLPHVLDQVAVEYGTVGRRQELIEAYHARSAEAKARLAAWDADQSRADLVRTLATFEAGVSLMVGVETDCFDSPSYPGGERLSDQVRHLIDRLEDGGTVQGMAREIKGWERPPGTRGLFDELQALSQIAEERERVAERLRTGGHLLDLEKGLSAGG